MYVIRVEEHPGGDETKARQIALGKVCNLRTHEPGSPLGDFHAYFEANEVPRSEPKPYTRDDLRKTYHSMGSAVVEDFPRFDGSIWDLIATMLRASGIGTLESGDLAAPDTLRAVRESA